MYFLYNFILTLIAPFLVLYHTYRSISRGRPTALGQRFGFLDPKTLQLLNGQRPIWVHAVSVGETIAVKPMLAAIKLQYPGEFIILSNMTETGRGVARTIKEVDGCIYFPFDYPFAVSRLLKRINPSLVIIVETELWPNFLQKARKQQIPVMIVNGRISDRSYKRYLSLKRFFLPVLQNVTSFCMQSSLDAERITAIGAPADSVIVSRNLKFDIPVIRHSGNELAEIRSGFRINGSCQVLTAGSTHQGEEELVLDAFSQIVADGQQLTLILVPRHPERAGEVCQLLDKRKIAYRKRSSLSADSNYFKSGEVLLVDTIGELMSLYAIADVVFVGGSLVPTGGHNLLEPASLGRPVLFGLNMSNFREIAAMTLEYGAGIEINSPANLTETVSALLADEDRRKIMGENGRRILAEQGGATELNMAVIRKFQFLPGARRSLS